MNLEQASKEVNLLASFLDVHPSRIHIGEVFYKTPKGRYMILDDRGYKLYQWVHIRDAFVNKRQHTIGGVDAMKYLTNAGRVRFETYYGRMPELVSFDDIDKQQFVAEVMKSNLFENCVKKEGLWIIPIPNPNQ